MRCKDCNFSSTLELQDLERRLKEEQVEKLSLERMSQRAIARITGVSRMTIAKLQKKISVPIAQTVTPLRSRPTLELDELWSFVNNKGQKVWIWIALERETRRIVGLAFGDRSSETCVELWNSLPADYRKRAVLYSDFWSAYAEVLPKKRHFAVGKESGETAHIERFNNTLRQRCPNLVRKTLLFSKCEERHQARIRTFIDHYNRPLEAAYLNSLR